MSEREIPAETQGAAEEEKVVTPQQVQEANYQNRKAATRPSWMAGLAALVFIGGLAAFMFHF
ncbi:MAG TPA: hypothetical protein VLN73_04705 [Alphaproteobacteria bacterium]|nr:hypothetical protein [Alphaproteobacteria bacterium]